MHDEIRKNASFILQNNQKYSILYTKFIKKLHAKAAQIWFVQDKIVKFDYCILLVFL